MLNEFPTTESIRFDINKPQMPKPGQVLIKYFPLAKRVLVQFWDNGIDASIANALQLIGLDSGSTAGLNARLVEEYEFDHLRQILGVDCDCNYAELYPEG